MIKNLKELQELLKDAVKKRPKGNLIFGLKLKEEEFNIPILPTRLDLDDACPENPVFIIRYDGHIGILNTKALELIDVTAETEVPEGGEIRKNDQGELTGIITENALDLVFSKIPKFLDHKPEIMQEVAEKAFKTLAEKGITSIHGILQLERIPKYKSILNKFLQDWYPLISVDNPKELRRELKLPLDGEKEDSTFKIRCWKCYFDGTFGAKTAYMHEPFSDAPDMSGFGVIDEDELFDKMKTAHNGGFQIAIHVIGDKGNEIIVNLYKKLLNEFPRENHRHRIEHASMLTQDLIKDIRKYKLIASCQPPFINSEYTWLEKRLGRDRCKYTYPYRSLLDAEVRVASGSDCPVEDPNVILGLHALVTRNGFFPEECITMEEALKTYTINAAYAAFEENTKGSIVVDKLADFVILDKNPLEIANDEIKSIQVLETIIKGKTVFKRENKN